ncbi:AsmA-like C-terminal region-containing protein [Hydrogenophaga sp.]|uniref:AsmA-like C-terminal region-containing protein n=1 Tax=Hydrogenophaga sp. TaxID=1904254 RepID=UPI00271F12B9|nr:AsmA-like C-terminal region-containing protein [Hydrogenophaga sp.]MDO9435605.1 AsmA-like C-terminal region-containing protein [Hydrogenophaga sp.]
MTPKRRWAYLAAAIAALFAAAWLLLLALVPSDDELARRVEAEFESRFGQKLVVGAVRWRVLGLPMVEVQDAHTEQPEPIHVRRAAIYPELIPLLQKRLVINRLEVDGAEVPRNALAAYRGKEPSGEEGAVVVVRHVAFTDVTYISYSGVPVVYEGDIAFDDDRMPQRVQLRRPGAQPSASLDAVRDGKTEGGADVYQLQLQAAGGSARGQASLLTTAEGRITLTGTFEPRQVDVSTLLDTFNRRSPIGGAASGTTELRAEGDTLAELFRSLHTRSVLEVQSAKILRFNMEKAVKSLGEDTAGQTPLESLVGVVTTQNTEQGMRTEFTRVKAVAGPYTATGRATLYRKQVNAQGIVEIGGGVVDVPFAARGPTAKPEFEVAWGTIAGAVVGTAVMPGVGTVIGAKIGGVISGPPGEASDKDKPLPPYRR